MLPTSIYKKTASAVFLWEISVKCTRVNGMNPFTDNEMSHQK